MASPRAGKCVAGVPISALVAGPAPHLFLICSTVVPFSFLLLSAATRQGSTWFFLSISSNTFQLLINAAGPTDIEASCLLALASFS